jgi:hypothetical protein
MWDLWLTKSCWDRFSPTTSVSAANSHSTDCSTFTLTYHLGMLQQASYWPTYQEDSVFPHPKKLNKPTKTTKGTPLLSMQHHRKIILVGCGVGVRTSGGISASITSTREVCVRTLRLHPILHSCPPSQPAPRDDCTCLLGSHRDDY